MAPVAPPRLIATDLDGTFLNPDGAVSELNFQAVTKAKDAGITVVVATGRPLRLLDAIDQLKALDPLLISCNGAVVKRLADEQVLHLAPLDPQIAGEVARDLRAEVGERVSFAVEYATGWGREPEYAPNPSHAGADVTDDIEALLTVPNVVKLLVQARQLPTNVLAELAEPIAADRLTATYSSISDDGLLEIGAPGVTKATALQQILDDLAIDPVAVAAFGDMPNDLDMLRLVGMPYRMAECHHALEVADFPLAGSNADSGVGRTILALLEGEALSGAAD